MPAFRSAWPTRSFARARERSRRGEGVLVERSEIRFVAKQLGGERRGPFPEMEGRRRVPAAGVAHSKAVFDVDLASVDLASEDTEREITAAPGSTPRIPVAHFARPRSRRGGDRYEIAGDLSIKGVARPVVVSVTIARTTRQQRRRGQLALKRSITRSATVSGRTRIPSRTRLSVRIRMSWRRRGETGRVRALFLRRPRSRTSARPRRRCRDAALHPEVGALDLRRTTSPPQRSFAVAVAGLQRKRSTVSATGFVTPRA